MTTTVMIIKQLFGARVKTPLTLDESAADLTTTAT